MNFENWWKEKEAEMREKRRAFYKNDVFDLLDLKTIAEEAFNYAQPQWLDIKDAPKDGRFLLLGWFNELGKWQSVNGMWFSKEQILQDGDFSFAELDDSEEDLSVEMEGWYEVSIECDADVSCWKIKPTHFMLNPTPPDKSNG